MFSSPLVCPVEYTKITTHTHAHTHTRTFLLSLFRCLPSPGGHSCGERGAPSITFQTTFSRHLDNLGETSAMVWSGMSVGITNNCLQRPQRTNMSSWSEVFVVKAHIAFNSDIAYTKRPLFDDVRNNYAAPSPLKDLWRMGTLPLQAYSKGMII